MRVRLDACALRGRAGSTKAFNNDKSEAFMQPSDWKPHFCGQARSNEDGANDPLQTYISIDLSKVYVFDSLYNPHRSLGRFKLRLYSFRNY